MELTVLNFISLNGNELKRNERPPNTRYVHRLADVHLAGFAPAFTLSFHESECSRKPPMPIASVIRFHSKKKRQCKVLKLLSI